MVEKIIKGRKEKTKEEKIINKIQFFNIVSIGHRSDPLSFYLENVKEINFHKKI